MNHRPLPPRFRPTCRTLVDSPQRVVRATVFGIRVATILLVVFWAAMFAGTHMPRVPMPHVSNVDKFFHFGGFAGLAFLMAWAIPTQHGRPRWNVLVAALASVGYAAVDEFSQIPVGRTADVLDWLADTAGVTAGLTAYLITRTLLQRSRSLGRVRLTMTQ